MKSAERVILKIPKGTVNANFKSNAAFEKQAQKIIGVRIDIGNYKLNGVKSISKTECDGIRVLLNPDSKTKQYDLPLGMFIYEQPSNLLYLVVKLASFDMENSLVTLPEAFDEDKIVVFTFFID